MTNEIGLVFLTIIKKLGEYNETLKITPKEEYNEIWLIGKRIKLIYDEMNNFEIEAYNKDFNFQAGFIIENIDSVEFQKFIACIECIYSLIEKLWVRLKNMHSITTTA